MNLSIKNVPEPTVERLRARARRHHRSLQGELLNIVEGASRPAPVPDLAALMFDIRALGLTRRDEAARMIREDRDAR